MRTRTFEKTPVGLVFSFLLFHAAYISYSPVLAQAGDTEKTKLKERYEGELLKAQEFYKLTSQNKNAHSTSFADSCLQMAGCLDALGERHKAYAFYERSLQSYISLPSSVDTSNLESSMWFFAKNYVAQSTSRNEEQAVLNSLFSALEGKKGYQCLSCEFDMASHLFYGLERHSDGLLIMNRLCTYLLTNKSSDIETCTQYVRLMSDMYQRINEMPKIEMLDRRVLALAEAQYGKTSIKTLDPICNLARFCIFQKRDAEAAQLVARSLGLLESAGDIQTFDKVSAISEAYLAIAQLENADSFLRRAASIKAKHLPKEKSNYVESTLFELSQKYIQSNKFKESESILICWRSAQTLGSDGDNCVRNNLMDLYLQSASRLKQEGKKDESQADLSKFNLLFDQDLETRRLNDKSSIPEYLESTERRLKAFGLETPADETVLPPAAPAQTSQAVQPGLPDEVAQRQKNIAEYVKNIGPARLRKTLDPLGHIDAAMRLATMRAQTGEKEQALSLFLEAVSTYKQIPSGDSAEAATNTFWNFILMSVLRKELVGREIFAINILIDAAEKRKDYQCLAAGVGCCSSLESTPVAAGIYSSEKRIVTFLLDSKPDDLALIGPIALTVAQAHRRMKLPDSLETIAESLLARVNKTDSVGADDLAYISAVLILADIHPGAEQLTTRAIEAVGSQSDPDVFDKIANVIEAYTSMDAYERAMKCAFEVTKIKGSRFRIEWSAYTDAAINNLLLELCRKKDFQSAVKVSEAWLLIQPVGSSQWGGALQNQLPVYAGRAAELRKVGNLSESNLYLGKFKNNCALTVKDYKKRGLEKDISGFREGSVQILKENGLPSDL